MRKRFSPFAVSVSAAAVLLLALAGCGTGETVSMDGGTDADQAAVMQALEESGFFGVDLTDTDEDAEASAEAVYGADDAQQLAAVGGTAVVPLRWWRGQIQCLGRTVDIHVEDGTATVDVVHDIAGTLFMADRVGQALVLRTKPFEDTVTRHALFTKTLLGWRLTAISPVEFAAADAASQTVHVVLLRASVGDTVVWEADDPAVLHSVPEGMPTFTPGDVVRVEAAVTNEPSGWTPSEFVFLHRPGHMLAGRRTRDAMFDDGTNGDVTAGDGVYTRIYIIGPHPGRHFAAVDAIDSATFMEEEAPYNSGAWGMPYVVK